jgi:hypothetical protein
MDLPHTQKLAYLQYREQQKANVAGEKLKKH